MAISSQRQERQSRAAFQGNTEMPHLAACEPRGCNANISNAISSSTGTTPHLPWGRKSTPSFHPELISIIWAMRCSSQITSNSTLLLCPVVNGMADNTHALRIWIVLLFPQFLWTKPGSRQLLWPCRYHPYRSVCDAGATVCLCLVAFTQMGISKVPKREKFLQLQREHLWESSPCMALDNHNMGKNNHRKKCLDAWWKSTRWKEDVCKVFCISSQQDQDTVLDYDIYVS